MNHPGPLFAYLLAALQALLGRHEVLTVAAVSFLQASTVASLTVLAWSFSRSLLLASTLPWLLVLNHHFILYMRWLWNVSIVTPALALALVLVLVRGDEPAPFRLPVLAAVLSLAAQAHMGFLPLALWLGGAALWSELRDGRSAGSRVLLGTGAVLVLAWLPVALDAARNHGGNPRALLRRFTSGAPAHTLGEMLAPLDGVTRETLDVGSGLRAGCVVVSLAALLYRRERRSLRAAAVLFGAWMVVLASLRTIPEPIQAYYLRPVSVLFDATLLAGVGAALELLGHHAARPAAAAVLAAAALVVAARPAVVLFRRFRDPGWNTHPLSEIRAVASAVKAASAGSCARVDVCPSSYLDGAAPAFDYALKRAGVENRADCPRRFLVCDADAATRAEPLTRTPHYRLEAR